MSDGLVENTIILSGGDALVAGVWAHLEARRVGEKVILKLDGREVAQAAFTEAVHASPAPVLIGARWDAAGEAENGFAGGADVYVCVRRTRG